MSYTADDIIGFFKKHNLTPVTGYMGSCKAGGTACAMGAILVDRANGSARRDPEDPNSGLKGGFDVFEQIGNMEWRDGLYAGFDGRPNLSVTALGAEGYATGWAVRQAVGPA